MKLHEALNVTSGDVVAFVGAGGKTSALVALGYELAEAGLRVLATTTTRIGADQLPLIPAAVTPDHPRILTEALDAHRFAFVYDQIQGGKVYGLPSEHVGWLRDSVGFDVLLIEADGARGLPFKAPRDHEPVIPAETTLVVPMVGLKVLGQPLNEDHVFNATAMIEQFGFYENALVKAPWVAQVLREESMGLKDIPPTARVVALLNQVGRGVYVRARARRIARLALLSPRLSGVAIGQVREPDPIHEVQRPVSAVVLAAGMSRRMGQFKLLLPWEDDKTVLEHVIEQLWKAHVDEVVVVTGNRSDEVRTLAEAMGARVVFNPDYATGEMLSSLQTGLRALSDRTAAAMVVLGDQPRLQPRIVQQVMMAYAEGKGAIIAPSYQMRRGHPILIDRRFWRELLALPADGAPRDVINAHSDQLAYVVVEDDSVLTDIDTPQDYAAERKRAGLDH